MSVSYMTHDGYEKLKTDLEELKSKGRDGAAKAIAEAREKRRSFRKCRIRCCKKCSGYA